MYVKEGSVAKIELNRPEVLNSFNHEMRKRLLTTVEEAGSDPTVRVVRITGKGRAFSAGQDIKEIVEARETGGFDLSGTLTYEYNRLIKSLTSIPKPVVAEVNGVAAGAGFSIVLACDVRFAAKSATFVQAFTKVGLIPDSGSSFFLPRSTGYARAIEMVFNAEQITAEKAAELGLINRVVEVDELSSVVSAYCEKLAHGPTKAYGMAKLALRKGMASSLEEALATEAVMQGLAGKTKDYIEGVDAFLEKRQPSFKGV